MKRKKRRSNKVFRASETSQLPIAVIQDFRYVYALCWRRLHVRGPIRACALIITIQTFLYRSSWVISLSS